jgi:hypothetical protein
MYNNFNGLSGDKDEIAALNQQQEKNKTPLQLKQKSPRGSFCIHPVPL